MFLLVQAAYTPIIMPNTRKNSRNVSTTEDINARVARLSTCFQTEMDKFRKELTSVRQADVGSESRGVATIDELLQKFNEFQLNVETELRALRSQLDTFGTEIKQLGDSADINLQHSYRSKLLVYGIPENDNNKNPDALVDQFVNTVNTGMGHKVEIQRHDISDCYRFGKKSSDRPRAILVDFVRVLKRNQIYGNKSAFKGSRIVVAEYLTRSRFKVFKEAKRRFNKDCWTLNGEVFVSVNGQRRLIRDLKDMN